MNNSNKILWKVSPIIQTCVSRRKKNGFAESTLYCGRCKEETNAAVQCPVVFFMKLTSIFFGNSVQQQQQQQQRQGRGAGGASGAASAGEWLAFHRFR